MIIIVMGVAGAGKSTIGERLARTLGWAFEEGDNYHPAENIAKMTRGQPLTDQDRELWLARLAARVHALAAEGGAAVVTCSALKRAYRRRLRVDATVRFVYLKGDYDLIHRRLQRRHGHYMEADMLASQFADLEEPCEALSVDVSEPPAKLVERIMNAFGLQPRGDSAARGS